jgi:RNAse (barnase) inhibitor barstar
MSKVGRCISNLEDFHDLAFDEWKNQQQKSSHLDLDVLLKDAQIPINIAWLVFIVP